MNKLGIKSLDDLVSALSQLPGIGRKTAQRLAIFILKGDSQFADELSQAIINIKHETRLCRDCFNISEEELCSICRDPRRDRSKICVVEDIVDVLAVEESHEYNGIYHILGGVISPLSGVTPGDLHIQELVKRARNGAEEILLALNPSTEGEATMIYISRLLKEDNLRITRIASGVPIGSHLEFLDTATIGRAILTRRDL